MEAKIKLTEEAIKQIKEDLERVQTDWGRSVLVAELTKLEKELASYREG